MNKNFINHLIDNDYKPFLYKKNINFELDNPNRIILVWAKDIEEAYEQISKAYLKVHRDKIKEITLDDAVAFIRSEEEIIEKQIKKIQNKMNNYLYSFNHLLVNEESISEKFEDFQKELQFLLGDDFLKTK